MTNDIVQGNGTRHARVGASLLAAAIGLSATQGWAAKPPQNQVPTANLTSPATGSTYIAPAAISLAATAADTDGTVAKVDFLQGTTLLGSDATAPYAFTWTNVSAGTYSLTARATDNKGATGTSTAVSVTVTASNPPTVSLSSPANGSTYTAPATIAMSATAADTDGTVTKVEFFQGATLLGSDTSSPYAFSWTSVPIGTYTLTARATDNSGVATTSSASSVTVTAAPPPNLIASPANGAVIFSPQVTVSGTFVGATGTTTVLADNGQSTRLAVKNGNAYSVAVPLHAGSNTITVRVSRIDKTSDTASVTVTGTQGPMVVFTSPTANSFEAPSGILFKVDALSPEGPIAKVEFFADSQLAFADTSQPFEYTWPNPRAGEHEIQAVATDSNGFTGSRIKGFGVTAPIIPPTVSITTPSNGASFFAPADITFEAEAADPDGSVIFVQYSLNDIILGTSYVPPYSFTWTDQQPGTYTVVARAMDDVGATATSSVTVTVLQPNSLPTVALTAPAGGSVFTEPASITLAANAADVDGSISAVYFYANGNPIGTATTPPYTFNWADVVAGSYSLTARAADDRGGIALSAPVSISVNGPPPNQPPSVTLTSPTNGTTLFSGSKVLLSANATDGDGSIAKVDFYAGATLLGSSTAAPYDFEWTVASPGTHELSAHATDNDGAVTISAAVSVTANSLQIVIDSPLDGAVLTGNHVLVRGTLSAPFNSGVTVNGVVAAVDDDGQRFWLSVPIETGTNTLKAVLSTQTGEAATQSVSVTADGIASPLEILVEDLELVAPEATTFTFKNHGSETLHVESNISSPFDIPVGGTMGLIYQASVPLQVYFTSTDQHSRSTTQAYAIVPHYPARMDQRANALWMGMNNALMAGDLQGALTYVNGSAASKYGPVFELLMPEYAAIVASFSALSRGSLSIEVTEYLVRRVTNGTQKVYFVYFGRGPDGVWRVSSM